MHRPILTAGALTLAFATVSSAQEAAPGSMSPTELDTLIVAGGLTALEEERSGRAYTIITGEELETRQVRYVADALRTVPGFSVSRLGAPGGQTQVRVRGAEANHLLVLIDGVEVSETATGEFDFGSLLVSNIERIEVLRGPQSAFWGSNAMAGVVNIVTKRGERNGFTTSARTEAGTDGTFLGGVSLSGGAKNYDVALSGAWRRSDGYNISDFGSEKDGDENVTTNGRFTYDINPDLTLSGTLRYVNRRSETDTQDFDFPPGPTYGLVIDSDDETETEELFGSLQLEHVSLGGALTQTARVTGSDVTRENFAGGGSIGETDGNRVNARYQASYEFATPGFADAVHTLTGGYEYERETFGSSTLSDRQERDTNSFVAEYRGAFLDQFYLNGAVRHDLNDAFADATTFSLSGAWQVPSSDTRLHASVGTGITNPTFYEQFGFDPDSFVGNPDLTPEESFGWDIGIEQGFFNRALVVDVTYFNQDLTNEIETVFTGTGFTVDNRDGESERQGVEVAATVDFFNGFSVTGTYTWLDATEPSALGGPDLREVRRPEHSGSLNARYRFYENRAEVFGEVIFNGEAIDNFFGPAGSERVTLAGYETVTIGGSFGLTENVELYGRVENLFDEGYEEVFGYNAGGREAFVGLRGTF